MNREGGAVSGKVEAGDSRVWVGEAESIVEGGLDA